MRKILRATTARTHTHLHMLLSHTHHALILVYNTTGKDELCMKDTSLSLFIIVSFSCIFW